CTKLIKWQRLRLRLRARLASKSRAKTANTECRSLLHTLLVSCTFAILELLLRDHVGILVYKHKKKLLVEEKATGITPDEPTELENLLDMIIALEESGEAELQETQGAASKKRQYDRAKAEDVRLKAMEELSETKKRGSSADESDDKPKRQRRSGGEFAIE
ncbi:unnamed protein product, partial [Porites lobata]